MATYRIPAASGRTRATRVHPSPFMRYASPGESARAAIAFALAFALIATLATLAAIGVI